MSERVFNSRGVEAFSKLAASLHHNHLTPPSKYPQQINRKYKRAHGASMPVMSLDFMAINPEKTPETVVVVPSTSETSAPPATSASSLHRTTTRLPSWISFPVTVLSSLALSAGLYTLLPGVIGYELAAVSRRVEEPLAIGLLLSWKVAEIAVAWTAGLDHLDMLSLALLSNAPYYILLHVFFETSYSALAAACLIDMISLALPFYALRPTNFYNARKRTDNPRSVSEIASDRSINFYMTAFAAAIYSLVVYSSFYTWLPVYMLLHFDEVRSLDAAHNATLPILVIACLPIGYAAKNLLFKPSIAASRAVVHPFVPAEATFFETLEWNLGLGKHSDRTSILTSRTGLLVGVSVLNTVVRVFGTVEGTDLLGALGWAGLWGAAALGVGVGFAWVGES